MVNKSKAKGTAAETRVVNYLNKRLAPGFEARRVVLKGVHDQGDVHIVSLDQTYKIMLEVKAGKQTQNFGRKQKEDWLAEARKEGKNCGMDPYLVIAKYGCSVCDYHVWSPDGRKFSYLDQFVDLLHEVTERWEEYRK